MYNVSRCSQGSAHRAPAALRAEQGAHLDQRHSRGAFSAARPNDSLVSNELMPAITDDVPQAHHRAWRQLDVSREVHIHSGGAFAPAAALELQAHDYNRAAGVEGV